MKVMLKKLRIRRLLLRKIIRSRREQIGPIMCHISKPDGHCHHLLLFHFRCSMLGSNLKSKIEGVNNIIWRLVWNTILRERIYIGRRHHHGWQPLNDPSSNLPVLLSDRQCCGTIWRVLWNMTWRVLSNKIQREELKPGDHVYTWRHIYSYAHHGIYVGDGKVVHFTRGGGKDRIIFSSSASHPSESTCAISSDHSRLDRVVCTSINDFLSSGELYRFEYGVSLALFIAKTRGGTCTLARSAPLQVVQDRLAYHLNYGFGDYHLFKNNCEDFAIYCKTGFQVAVYNFSVGRSGQAVSFVVGITAFISSTIQSPAVISTVLHTIVHFIIGYSIYSACRWASDIGVRPNVSKDADEELAEEESSGCCGNTGSSKFKSALLKRLVWNILVVAIWWICCYELQWTTEYMSYLLGWVILTGSAWVAFFVPIDSGRKENSSYFNLLPKHLRVILSALRP